MRTRTGVRSLFRWLGGFGACALVLFVLSPRAFADAPAAGTSESPTVSGTTAKGSFVYQIDLSSSINPGTADYVERAIEKARQDGAECLLLQMDTPGGLLESTRLVVRVLLNSDLPVLVYVGPRGARAGSAGVFITLAGHVAAMAPGTNIGAAHPITGGGKDPEEAGGKHLAKKIENDTAAFIETIANQRKRNVTWAKDAVLESVSVTEVKALELGVIDLVADSPADLLRKVDGRSISLPTRSVTLKTADARIEPLEMSWRQGFVDFFSNPNIIYFLMIVAALGLYLELSHPGAILPGVAAAVSIILILLSSQSLPFNMAGVLLLVLATIFFILEVYVTSFGMLTVAGLASFFMGSILLFETDGVTGFIGVSRSTILLSSLLIGGVVAVTAYLIARSQRSQVTTGAEGLIGRVVPVLETINPTGRIELEGEYWTAVSETPIEAGRQVKVVAIEGLKARVVPFV